MPTVELFGRAQLLAGARAVPVEANTLGEALRELARHYPQLIGPVLEQDGRPNCAYALNLGGQRFITDLAQRLESNEQILLISSLSGG